MSSSAPPRDRDNRPLYVNRSIFRTHIVIHRLVILTTLTLLPLLAWHNAMTHLSDEFDMPTQWEEDFRESQVSGPKVGVWVLMWIFIPVDALHALLCVAWYHEPLHPKAQAGEDTDKREEMSYADANDRDTSDRNEHQWSTGHCERDASPITPSSRVSVNFDKFNTVRRRILSYKKSFTPLHPKTPLTYHPLLYSVHPPKARLILLASYDTMLVMVLVLHICTYLVAIVPSMAFCDVAERKYSQYTFKPMKNVTAAKDVDFPELDARQRCERLNWNIHIAGGFASALAALLATMHIAALVCRLFEGCCMVLERRRHKQEARLEGIRLEQMQPSWQNPPRDIEIHTRGTRKHNETPTTTGRLTKISEEEISTGGEVVRRRHASKSASGESGRFKSKSGGSGGLEDVLLECLVP